MAFIPDNAFKQRLEDKISPIQWEFYQYLCIKRNHETRLSQGTVEGFISEWKYKRASKFNLLKELKTSTWIAGNDGAYSLTFGDFTPADKRADERKLRREQQSKKIDSAEQQSKFLNSESKKIDEKSKKIDSHIRNIPASFSSNSQESNDSFEGEKAPLREIPVDEIFEIAQPQIDERSSRAVEIYRDIFPTYNLDGQQLQDFIDALPEVEEDVWRQTLFEWRLSRYKASNIAGMICKYGKNLKEKENGSNQKPNNGNKRTDADVFAESADFYQQWEQREAGNFPN
jgi:hypothetical protein